MVNIVSKLAVTGVIGATLALAGLGPADAQEKKLRFQYVTHGSVQYPFFVKLKKGMDDACARFEVECQFIEIKTIGNVQELRTALEQAIVKQPDGIAIAIINDEILDEPIQKAIDMGIPVVAFNADDTEGGQGSARLSYIGQNERPAGYALAQAVTEFLPKEGPIHVLIGVQDFAQTQLVARGQGIGDFMKDYKAANPDRQVTWDEIETGIDAGVIASRVGAYVQKNPNTTAYIDTGFFHASAAIGLRDLGYKPGNVILAGFDMVQMVFDEMKTGYIQVSIDQQGYLQGFLPIVQLYLMNIAGAGAWDVDTGKQGLFYPEDVAELEEMVQKGMR